MDIEIYESLGFMSNEWTVEKMEETSRQILTLRVGWVEDLKRLDYKTK